MQRHCIHIAFEGGVKGINVNVPSLGFGVSLLVLYI